MARTTPHPWYRHGRGWYVTIKGTQHRLEGILEGDEAGARAAVLELLAEKIAGKVGDRLETPNTPPTAPNTGPTVSEAVSLFLAKCVRRVALDQISPGCHERYSSCLRQFAEMFGERRCDALQALEVEAWAKESNWSNSTMNHYLAIVQRCLRAVGVLLKLHRPPNESRGADAVLSDEQFALVLADIRREDRSGRRRGDLAELLELLWFTGARPQEAAQLRVETVDWNLSISIPKHHKGSHRGQQRILRFASEARKVLDAQREKYKTGYLFRTIYGKPYAAQVISVMMARVSERLGFKAIAYSCRHSYATRALEAGIPDAVVAALLGHKGTNMIHTHYSHVANNAKLLMDAAERASRKTA